MMQTQTKAHREKMGTRPLLAERRQLFENLSVQVLFAALGALTGSAELLFGVRPFGVALAAAGTSLFPSAALGALLFYAWIKDLVSLVAIAALALVRVGIAIYLRNGVRKRRVFTERVSWRVVTAAGVLLGTGLFRVIRGGFRFFDLFGLLLAVAAGAIATLLLAGTFEKKDRLFPYSREAGLCTLVLIGIFALREVSFFGVYPSAVAAALGAFLLVVHRGLSLGAVAGGLSGLCFEPRMAPALLLCGLCFGLLEKSSRGGGILCGSGVAAVAAYAVSGTDGITRLLPALLTAGALFLAGDSAGLVEGSPGHRAASVRRRAAAQSVKTESGMAEERRLKELSTAFSDLSGTFFELSNRMRKPALSDLRHLCDRAFDEVCPGCRHRDVCWGSEYHATADALGALGTRLQQKGAVGREQLPAMLASRCTAMPQILERINAGALRLSEESLRGDKTSVVAVDYAAMGRLIGEALEECSDARQMDVAAGERILERLQRLGYVVESVAVSGKKHRLVILRGIRLPGRHLMVRELRRVLEQHCRFRLGSPRITEAEGMTDMVFPERTSYRSATVKETRAKGKGEGRYCGDSVMALTTEQGYDYACLCDGMGSGNAAALTSALASTFLYRLLQSGVRADTALRMLNGFLSARGVRDAESSTTVDLLEIDRISGEASLFKCGAAPTYLLRRGEVTRFASRTAPVGILESLDAERIRFEVEAGDVLVQISDGVTKGEEDCPWLAQMLKEKWDGDKENFARMVLNRATQEGEDDLSVMVTAVTAAPAPGEK
jgi:stage II sporulation protein E